MNSQKGSAILVVLISLSAILIVSASLWRSTAYLVEIGEAKSKTMRSQFLAQAGLVYAGALVTSYYAQLVAYLEHTHFIVFSCDHWPTGGLSDEHSIVLRLSYASKPGTFELQVDLKHHKLLICQLKAVLEPYELGHPEQGYTLHILSDL